MVEIYVYKVRYDRGAYWIAEFSWDRPLVKCVRFGPDAIGNQLVESGKIRCHDADMSDWARRESVWDYTGNSASERTEDMAGAEYALRNGAVVIKDAYSPLTDIAPEAL